MEIKRHGPKGEQLTIISGYARIYCEIRGEELIIKSLKCINSTPNKGGATHINAQQIIQMAMEENDIPF